MYKLCYGILRSFQQNKRKFHFIYDRQNIYNFKQTEMKSF